MRKAIFTITLSSAAVLVSFAAAQAQSQAQSQGQGRLQSPSQSMSQSMSQAQSQAGSQSQSQAGAQPQGAMNNRMDGSSQSSPDASSPAPSSAPPSAMSPGAMRDMPEKSDGSDVAMNSMETRHMDMGPHMKMTALRVPQPGDAERAASVAAAARKVAEKYSDYKVALANGFQIFMPNVPQKMYHFTNYHDGYEAAFHFDPDRPTSLLYEKQGDGYKLVGIMYTARKNATEEELNERVPLSVAQWHAHVDLCMPPAGSGQPSLADHSQFGFRGTIHTKEACDAAGGVFKPQVFGWMVHVYPFEQKLADVWSVERQAPGHMD
jgi:hypothetical protein